MWTLTAKNKKKWINESIPCKVKTINLPLSECFGSTGLTGKITRSAWDGTLLTMYWTNMVLFNKIIVYTNCHVPFMILPPPSPSF